MEFSSYLGVRMVRTTGSERMKLIEGSADGINWVPYAMKTNDTEARAAAATCILKTKHTHVRIIEVKT